MSDFPEFLPEALDLNGPWDESLELLHDVFTNDFIKHRLFYDKAMVLVDNRKADDGREEGFWHLVTRTDKIAGRIPDFERAKRLSWIRPIIENFSENEIKTWDYLEGRGRPRTYVWLEAHNFVIVLERRGKARYFLITAYYVDGDYNRTKLRKKYNARI